MSRIIVTNHITLDGVMQAPARADEDTRGGFTHGGWGQPDNDEVMASILGEAMARGKAQGGALLFGRRTYEDFAAVWPNRTDNPFTEVLDNTQKYVASTTLTEPLPWRNSTLLRGDVVDAVTKLKAQSDKDLGILGSGELIQSLLRHDLIDEWLLMIHPIVLGTGRRLFPDGGALARLTLIRSVTTTKGVIMATYQRAEQPADSIS